MVSVMFDTNGGVDTVDMDMLVNCSTVNQHPIVQFAYLIACVFLPFKDFFNALIHNSRSDSLSLLNIA
jgi:hypothetical protein